MQIGIGRVEWPQHAELARIDQFGCFHLHCLGGVLLQSLTLFFGSEYIAYVLSLCSMHNIQLIYSLHAMNDNFYMVSICVTFIFVLHIELINYLCECGAKRLKNFMRSHAPLDHQIPHSLGPRAREKLT